MKPPRQDKEPVGLGASVSLAVVGVIVAGLGLVTMRSAFPPLPKADTPVVLVHADRPAASPAYHVTASAPVAVSRPEELAVAAPDPAPARVTRIRAARPLPRVERTEPRAQPVEATAPSPAPPAAAPQQVAAAPADDDSKLCKAPTPNVVTSKALEPGLILRYDPKLKGPARDIPPPRPPPEEERRLKLSALLADMLNN